MHSSFSVSGSGPSGFAAGTRARGFGSSVLSAGSGTASNVSTTQQDKSFCRRPHPQQATSTPQEPEKQTQLGDKDTKTGEYLFGTMTYEIIIKNLRVIIGVSEKSKLSINDGLYLVVDDDYKFKQAIKRTMYNQSRDKVIAFLKHLYGAISALLDQFVSRMADPKIGAIEREQVYVKFQNLFIDLIGATHNFFNVSEIYKHSLTVAEFEKIIQDYEDLVHLTMRRTCLREYFEIY